jgi:hypothetical protein
MRHIIKISIDDVKPNRNDILKAQGMPPGKEPSPNVAPLLNQAMEFFMQFSQPISVISEISIPEFQTVYNGEGLNERRTPLDEIFRRADNLALFALTLGEEVSQRIDALFKSNDFVLGTILDSIASVGADKAADVIEDLFFSVLAKKVQPGPETSVLRYSPGYCGWHVSGQKKLFQFLHPEEIGIILLESFLMKPLKSISGVLVAGKKEIHKFDDSYPFCSQCKTHSCRARIKALSTKSRNRKGAA